MFKNVWAFIDLSVNHFLVVGATQICAIFNRRFLRYSMKSQWHEPYNFEVNEKHANGTEMKEFSAKDHDNQLIQIRNFNLSACIERLPYSGDCITELIRQQSRNLDHV